MGLEWVHFHDSIYTIRAEKAGYGFVTVARPDF